MMSTNKLLKTLKKEQRNRVKENKKQIINYIQQNTKLKKIEIDKKLKYEDEIVFLINNSVSLKFLTKYFNVSEEYIKQIAKKNHSLSNLLITYTENSNSRTFTKSQILKTCEEFNYICPMCFKPLDITHLETLTGHHILPFSLGGKTTKNNCLPLHISCHFDDFKLLHSKIFDFKNTIYSAKYFNNLKKKLQKEESGITKILENWKKNKKINLQF